MRIFLLLCFIGVAFPWRAFSQHVSVSCWVVGTRQGRDVPIAPKPSENAISLCGGCGAVRTPRPTGVTVDSLARMQADLQGGASLLRVCELAE